MSSRMDFARMCYHLLQLMYARMLMAMYLQTGNTCCTFPLESLPEFYE